MRFSTIITDDQWAALESGGTLTAQPRERPALREMRAASVPGGLASRSDAHPSRAGLVGTVFEETARAWLRDELAARIGPSPAGVVDPLWGWADWGGGKGVPGVGVLWRAAMSGREPVELSGLDTWILCEVPDARVAHVSAERWRCLVSPRYGGLVPRAVQEARAKLTDAVTVEAQGPHLEARALDNWRQIFDPYRGRAVRDARVHAVLWSLGREDVVAMEEMPPVIGI